MKKQQKEYFELQLSLQGFDPDLLAGVIAAEGCLGVYESTPESWTVYCPGNWTPARMRHFLSRLAQINPDFSEAAVRVEKLPYQDWNAQWKQFFEPFEAVEGCWVRPPWKELPAGVGGLEIVIDPQMAFGTGHHETTRLMMQAMSAMPLAGKTVLDWGSGSGILAFYARLRGAAAVTGIDIDPDAVENARHNLQLNQLDGVQFAVGDFSLAEGSIYPVILANIHFEVLAAHALQLAHLLPADGTLLVSGILGEDVVRLSYLFQQAGLTREEVLRLKEWAAVRFSRCV